MENSKYSLCLVFNNTCINKKKMLPKSNFLTPQVTGNVPQNDGKKSQNE